MDLNFLDIQKGFYDLDKINKLNYEAFPKDERLEIDRLISLKERGLVDLKAVYDDELFVGFYSLTVYSHSVYLFFIAVEDHLRSKGYGSQILKQLHQLYKNYQIVIDMEPVVSHADNYEQRKIRKEFYLRNLYYETHYYMTYNQMTFELLSNHSLFDKDDFIKLLDTIRLPHFQPVIYLK